MVETFNILLILHNAFLHISMFFVGMQVASKTNRKCCKVMFKAELYSAHLKKVQLKPALPRPPNGFFACSWPVKTRVVCQYILPAGNRKYA